MRPLGQILYFGRFTDLRAGACVFACVPAGGAAEGAAGGEGIDFVCDDELGLYYAGDFCSPRCPGAEAAALSAVRGERGSLSVRRVYAGEVVVGGQACRARRRGNEKARRRGGEEAGRRGGGMGGGGGRCLIRCQDGVEIVCELIEIVCTFIEMVCAFIVQQGWVLCCVLLEYVNVE